MNSKSKILLVVVGVLVAATVVLSISQRSKQRQAAAYRRQQQEQYSEIEVQEDLTPTPTQEPSPTPIPTSTPKPTPTATPTLEPTRDPSQAYAPGSLEEMAAQLQNEQEQGLGQETPGSSSETGTGQQEEVIPIDSEDWELKRIVFIGDLRTNAMMAFTNSQTDLWECATSANCDWLMNTAFGDADPYAKSGTAVVIALGVNDPANLQAYIQAINTKAAAWNQKGAKVYFASVGPVEQNSQVTNQQIMDFNTAMYNQLNVPFIDVYNYLVTSGFSTIDGIQYDSNTAALAYNYISEVVRR